MQPNHLVALAYVARSGSLTHAARLLGRTQPALSGQLRQLAEAVGEPLIIRHRHGVRLTAAGEALLPPAEAVARSLDVAMELTDRLRGVKQGSLRVLTSTSVAAYLLPPLLSSFHEDYPGVDLRLRHATPQEAVSELGRNNADLAVMRAPIGAVPADFITSLLSTDETVLVVRPDHPLAGKQELELLDLDGLEIVTRADPSPTRRLIEQIAASAGVTLRVKFEVSTIEALKEAILQGFGAGFLSRLAVTRDAQEGRIAILRIKDPKLLRQIFLIYPNAAQSSPRVRAFLDILGQVAAAELEPAF